MREFDIVRISTYGDDEDDQNILKNNLRYPEAVQYVNPLESDVFIIDSETRQIWKANEFFQCVNVLRGTMVIDND